RSGCSGKTRCPTRSKEARSAASSWRATDGGISLPPAPGRVRPGAMAVAVRRYALMFAEQAAEILRVAIPAPFGDFVNFQVARPIGQQLDRAVHPGGEQQFRKRRAGMAADQRAEIGGVEINLNFEST